MLLINAVNQADKQKKKKQKEQPVRRNGGSFGRAASLQVIHAVVKSRSRGGEERITQWWRTRSVHHAGGDSQRGADGREDADDGLDNKLPGLFLGHGCGELVNE